MRIVRSGKAALAIRGRHFVVDPGPHFFAVRVELRILEKSLSIHAQRSLLGQAPHLQGQGQMRLILGFLTAGKNFAVEIADHLQEMDLRGACRRAILDGQ